MTKYVTREELGDLKFDLTSSIDSIRRQVGHEDDPNYMKKYTHLGQIEALKDFVEKKIPEIESSIVRVKRDLTLLCTHPDRAIIREEGTYGSNYALKCKICNETVDKTKYEYKKGTSGGYVLKKESDNPKTFVCVICETEKLERDKYYTHNGKHICRECLSSYFRLQTIQH